MRSPYQAVIALGTNIGALFPNLHQGVSLLKTLPSTTVVAVSNLYLSAPQYYEEQPHFLNAAVKINTILPPLELLSAIKSFEKNDMGRIKEFDNGPRVIDLDILFHNGRESEEEAMGVVNCFEPEHLIIPHPRIFERDFVLRPLNDIDSEFIHPVTNESISDMFEDFLTLQRDNGISESSLSQQVLPLPNNRFLNVG
jgi:dihydroneopterin aldolase/2-amino-4-hydroxy-6-hydroxymethyldihydropteridine diphosphokinase/dihydropteroate synthase